MDELTRERFWPRPLKAPSPLLLHDDPELIADRQRVLLDLAEGADDTRRHTRLGMVRRKRDRRLVAAIRRAAA